ncbi:hypothetical protein [Nannocystis pusilla]|uniref:GumC family protein n=1 Tax=Nannocystis pusilla TaxID=889268 RepID=UPI003B7A471B
MLHLGGPQVLDKVKNVTEDTESRLLAYKEYYQTQREIIGSRTVAERALATLGLAQDPVFLGIADIGSEAERVAQAAEVDPIERLRGMVFVEEVRGSRVLKISADYPDPQIAADIANALAEAYLAHVDASRVRTGDAAKAGVEAERAKALAALQLAEKALSDFKQDHGISSISLADRQNVITEAIIKTTANLKDAEAESFAASAVHEEAERLHKAGSIAGASLLPPLERRVFEDMRAEELEAEREVEQLAIKYGDKMPELQQARKRLRVIQGRIANEEKELLAGLKARANAARTTESRLRGSLDDEKGKALGLTLLERQYRELERESKAAAESYELVSKRDTEIEMLGRVQSEDIEILDRATKGRKPVFPPKALLVAVALVSGLTPAPCWPSASTCATTGSAASSTSSAPSPASACPCSASCRCCPPTRASASATCGPSGASATSTPCCSRSRSWPSASAACGPRSASPPARTACAPSSSPRPTPARARARPRSTWR